MRGEIIAIGDELTSGSMRNTTSGFAASHLFAAGHEIVAMTTIGDDLKLIGDTLRLALARTDFVLVTGGLGATTDDVTNEAVSKALDRPTTFYPDVLKKIKEHLCDISAGDLRSLEKLAWLPAGAHALKTDARMAGHFLVQDGKPIFFLPGVPHEMEELLLETVITRLSVWEESGVRQVRRQLYKVFGIAETEINRRLQSVVAGDSSMRLGYYPVYPEVHVSLTVTGEERSEVDTRFVRADEAIRLELADSLFALGQETMASVVGRMLVAGNRTLAVAESCTGGLIGHTITREAGSSAYFVGGVLAYSNALKEDLLHVDSALLARHGAVSTETARAMAVGVRRATGADYGVSVTGIAGPSGGTPEKPVGTVHIGLAGPDGIRDLACSFAGKRWQVQAISCLTALDMVRQTLRQNS